MPGYGFIANGLLAMRPTIEVDVLPTCEPIQVEVGASEHRLAVGDVVLICGSGPNSYWRSARRVAAIENGIATLVAVPAGGQGLLT